MVTTIRTGLKILKQRCHALVAHTRRLNLILALVSPIAMAKQDTTTMAMIMRMIMRMITATKFCSPY